MSSTNRGGKRSEADFYATPEWCVRRLLDELRLPPGDWLEPCAGDGSIITAIDRWRHLNQLSQLAWTAVELRNECCFALSNANKISSEVAISDLEISIIDFFEWSANRMGCAPRFDVVLTNPPFSLAMDFIRACLPLATHCIFLLRLNFLGSEERSKFIRETTPDIYVLPNRPSFTGEGTDSIEYAWFHWHDGAAGKYRILASTPKEERKRR